jgi:hypothetical protein
VTYITRSHAFKDNHADVVGKASHGLKQPEQKLHGTRIRESRQATSLRVALTFQSEDRGTISLKPRDSFQVPPNTPHAGGEPSQMDFKVYIVEKGKPLASRPDLSHP